MHQEYSPSGEGLGNYDNPYSSNCQENFSFSNRGSTNCHKLKKQTYSTQTV